eukprot:gnl/Chilomastix_caulleri/3870.p2 GENE.gnl/Chilomastix_caulleri/3870~~gnl/Chilomastix_caulleri/3870.p2  ORF type:complete len:52 (-),score=2.76 gnl/Chilomastix_caulleri/3870:112-267(-)
MYPSCSSCNKIALPRCIISIGECKPQTLCTNENDEGSLDIILHQHLSSFHP